VSLASAAAAYRRIAERIGPMTPYAALRTTPQELRADRVSRRKGTSSIRQIRSTCLADSSVSLW